jgi:hypothetical protein
MNGGTVYKTEDVFPDSWDVVYTRL